MAGKASIAHKSTALARLARAGAKLNKRAKTVKKAKPRTMVARRPTAPMHHSAPHARPVAKVITKTKYVFNAAKAPLMHVALDEGTRMGSHAMAYTLDTVLPWRALGGWLRPSTLLTTGLFALAAVVGKSQGGKWRALFRNLGQGGLHHVEARALDIVHEMVHPGTPGGMAGTDY